MIEAPDFEFCKPTVFGIEASSDEGSLAEFDYAEACANLYRTFLLENIEKGLNKVVLLGHSAGAASCVRLLPCVYPPFSPLYSSLATMFCDHPLFEAFIFVEPTIWPAEMAGVMRPCTNTSSGGSSLVGIIGLPRRRRSVTLKVARRGAIGIRGPRYLCRAFCPSPLILIPTTSYRSTA